MRNLLFILFTLTTVEAFAQSARLKIWLDPITNSVLHDAGIDFDHGVFKKDVFVISDFSAEERGKIEKLNVDYEVLIDNVSAYYSSETRKNQSARSSRSACFSTNENDPVETPSNFELGSMGGFFTYEEFLAQLDSMAAKFPAIITQRNPIDTFLSHQNRPIYWVKISDNPYSNETEPEVLYTAVHHAREPESLTQLIFYMWYMLENYGTDAEVTQLVDETELYFIPMINPDGYVMNQQTDPDGGGMWRKNMRDMGTDVGVDLNRNYGHEWAYDDVGSSQYPNSNTYRGPSAFSEPETKAVKWFCEQHEFDFALNYHSYGNYVIYPWGYIQSPLTPDSNLFNLYSGALVNDNQYLAGTGYQTVGYTTNGDSDDWMYGEQGSKNKIYSMTPEVGNSGDGFWPVPSRIIPIAKENLKPNMLLAHFAGSYLQTQETSAVNWGQLQGELSLEVTRLGLQFNGLHQVEVLAASSNVSVLIGATTFTNSFNVGATQNILVQYELDNTIQQGEAFAFDVITRYNGLADTQRVEKIFGNMLQPLPEASIEEFDSFYWNETTEDYVSSPTSITDSPFMNYVNDSYSEIEYKRVIDLTNALAANITFQAKWEIESGWDYVQALVSSESTNWQFVPVCGIYSREGNQYQDEGKPVWDGFYPYWAEEMLDLSDFLGQKIHLKFRLVSDQYVTEDGFYFDDLTFNLLLNDTNVAVDTVYWSDYVPQGVEESETNRMSIFPNPTDDLVMISGTATNQLSIEIYDIKGTLVLKENLGKKSTFNVSYLENGVYILKVKTVSDLQTFRLIKQ